MNFNESLINLKEFRTPRLLLRQLKYGDLGDVYDFCSNLNVARPMTWETNKTKEDTLKFLDEVITGYKTGISGEWAIEMKKTGKVVGVVAFINWSNKHRCIEIGYFLAEDYWGQGIATESLKELIQYGFHDLSANRIEGRCDTDNIGSQKVLSKIGMTFEGTLRKNELIKGEFRDTQIFSLLSTDYNERSNLLKGWIE
ncbi:GNAT family N-acetyltransferase [Halobacillus amylolyticus]|uniref:GNAT family N-acetyltransferase n=1 Tax=Halobacillus amylolyticus TaxID=2932259 RepID=A0ABY4HDB9_9BACI|nr:GNAT family protein [Halobacillus amylolyticus]UOR12878.1 GNAT family N-acetyltransferase [Halobacillus amylolyticus]